MQGARPCLYPQPDAVTLKDAAASSGVQFGSAAVHQSSSGRHSTRARGGPLRSLLANATTGKVLLVRAGDVGRGGPNSTPIVVNSLTKYPEFP